MFVEEEYIIVSWTVSILLFIIDITEQIVYLIKLDIISLKYDPKIFIFIWPRFFLTKMCWLYPLLHVKRCIAFHWPIYNLNRNWNKQNNIMACIVSKLLLYFEKIDLWFICCKFLTFGRHWNNLKYKRHCFSNAVLWSQKESLFQN